MTDWRISSRIWLVPSIPVFCIDNGYDDPDEMTRDLYSQGMPAFAGIASTYHIALLYKPTIIWDFHSLLSLLQMMFSFMLTDGESL